MRRVEGWLYPAETEFRLSAVATGLAALMGLQMAFFPWSELAALPPSLFRPVPLLWFLDTMPSAAVIVTIQVVGVVAAVLAAVGWRRPATFALAWLPYLALAGLRASRGKIQHNDLLLLIAAVPFLAAPATRWLHRASMTPSRRWGWPIRAALTVVAGAYFFTGLRKLLASGLAWVASDNMRWILYAGANGKAKVPEVAFFVADRPWLAHLAAAGVMAFELGFPFLMLWRRTRPALVVLAFAFHGGTWLTLGLDYWKYAFVVTLLLVDWHRPHARMSGWTNRTPKSSTPSSAWPSPAASATTRPSSSSCGPPTRPTSPSSGPTSSGAWPPPSARWSNRSDPRPR